MRREDLAGDNDAGDFGRAADIVLFFVVAQARAVDELANIPNIFAGNRLAGQRHVIEVDSQQAALLFAAAVERAQVRMDGSTMASVLRGISARSGVGPWVYLADVLVEIVNDHPNSAIDRSAPPGLRQPRTLKPLY